MLSNISYIVLEIERILEIGPPFFRQSFHLLIVNLFKNANLFQSLDQSIS